jgi:hypothetical protein
MKARNLVKALNKIRRAAIAAAGAPVSVFGLRGASPLQGDALRPVSESNCVLATGGGKQLEENDQSVTKVNSIFGRACLASLPANGEAQTRFGKPATLRGSVLKRWRERPGVWRRNGWKAKYIKQGDPGDYQDGVQPIARESERP